MQRKRQPWFFETDVQAGVKDIVLAVNYRPEVMVSVLKKTEEEYGITINFSVETEPLGTGAFRSIARSSNVAAIAFRVDR